MILKKQVQSVQESHDVLIDVQRLHGAQIGRLVEVDAEGVPFVAFAAALAAKVRAFLAAPAPDAPLSEMIGKRVVLLFEDGDPERPIIVAWAAESEPARATRKHQQDWLRIDGERVVISGAHEVELRCGEASITLTNDGNILIKGANVLNQALKINKIRGAAVRIN